jgi:hypothetical protein
MRLKTLTLAFALAVVATAASAEVYQCAGYRRTPPEAVERDPVVKTTIDLDKGRQFGVTHVTLAGESRHPHMVRPTWRLLVRCLDQKPAADDGRASGL